MTWPMVALGDVAEITMGQAPKGDTYNDKADGLPLIAGAGDFADGEFKVKKYTHSPTKVCNIGDIILGIRATIGVKIVSDGTYCLGRGVAGVRPLPDLDARFLWHGLTHTNQDLARKARGATFVQVSRKDIAELSFPLPPLEEQRRIAGILDAADALRRRRREALALLDTLPGAIFAEMFGDLLNSEEFERGPLEKMVSGFETGKNIAAADEGGARHWILKVSAVTKGEFIEEESKPLPAGYEPPENHLVRPGDLLFSRANTSALIGATALVETVSDNIVLPDKIWRFVLRPGKAEPTFVHFLFGTRDSVM